MKQLKIIICILPFYICNRNQVLAQEYDSLYREREDIMMNNQIELTDRVNDGEVDGDEVNQIIVRKKLDINKCGADDLMQIGLTGEEAGNILRYRKQAGRITDIHELQAVPGLDETSLKTLRRYAKVNQHQISFKDLLHDLSGGKSVLSLRADFYHTSGVDYKKYMTEHATAFMQSVRTRIKYVYTGSYLDGSLVGEKDAGETFGWNKRQKGMDVYMGNLRYRGNGAIKQIILGDYKVSMGQGLIIWQGFGGGLGMNGMTGRSQKEIFSPHRSYNEFYFKRGVAAELQWGQWQVGVFLSKRGLDASMLWDSTEQVQKIRTIYNTGLHADSLSDRRRNAITENSVGCRLVLHKSYGYFGLTAVGYDYGNIFYQNPDLYAFYYPHERRRCHTSADYSIAYSNLHFFGELATMNVRSMAMQHNLSLTLNKEIQIGLGYRDYNPAYRSADAMVIGLRVYPNNERGWMLQSKYSLSRGTEIWVSWDVSSSKWLRYGEIQPLHSSIFMFSYRKYDKQGNGLGFRFRRGVNSNLTSSEGGGPTNLSAREITISCDFQSRIKFGKDNGLFFRYVYREIATMEKRSNAGMFCWGLDTKWLKDFSLQWRMYLMEGQSLAGGIIVQEADLGGAQLMGWIYGNKQVFSFMANKKFKKRIKLGVKGQMSAEEGFDIYLKNNAKNIILSTQIAFSF